MITPFNNLFDEEHDLYIPSPWKIVFVVVALLMVLFLLIFSWV